MATITSGSILYNAPVSLFYTENPAYATYYNTYGNVVYYQRVYSTGLSQWCYYSTIGSIDSSPDTNQTSPNWTGTINNHQVVSVKGTV